MDKLMFNRVVETFEMCIFAVLTVGLWLIIYEACGLWYAATIGAISIVVCTKWIFSCREGDTLTDVGSR